MMKVVSLNNIDNLKPNAIKKVLEYSKAEFISSGNNLNFVLLDDDNNIIGEIDYSYPLESVDLLYIFIDKEKRGNGYSKLLFNESIKELKELNVKEIFLEVNVQNNVAKNLYETLGFMMVGTRKKYYDDLYDAIIMKYVIR